MVEQWQILPTLQTGENCGSGEPGGYSWLALLIVVSTAKSFPQKLLALIVRDYLEQLDSGCSVVKDILGFFCHFMLLTLFLVFLLCEKTL